jgi:hypothetical protein
MPLLFIFARIEAMPGAQHAAVAYNLPFAGMSGIPFNVAGGRAVAALTLERPLA